jgi:hypothetical protein
MRHTWERNVYRVLMGKPEGKRPLERPRRRWDQNGSLGDWPGECRLDPVGSGQGPEVGPCEYGDEPSGSGVTELVTLVTCSQQPATGLYPELDESNPHTPSLFP